MGLAASMANDMPDEKMPHITASSRPSLTLNSSHLGAQLHLFLVAGVGDDGHADERHQHARHGEQAAARGEQHGDLPVHQRRHQRAHDQRDADGHADAQRHAQVAHGEPVTHIADAPHGAEERDLQ